MKVHSVLLYIEIVEIMISSCQEILAVVLFANTLINPLNPLTKEFLYLILGVELDFLASRHHFI